MTNLTDIQQKDLRGQLAKAVDSRIISADDADRLFRACVSKNMTQMDLLFMRSVASNNSQISSTPFWLDNVRSPIKAKTGATLAILNAENSTDQAILRDIVRVNPKTFYYEKWLLENSKYSDVVIRLERAKTWCISAQNSLTAYLRAISEALDADRILRVNILKSHSNEEWIQKTQNWLRDNLQDISSNFTQTQTAQNAGHSGALKIGIAALAAFLLWNQFKNSSNIAW